MRVLTAGLACCCALMLAPRIGASPAAAQLAGHGGPVRALAVSSDGRTALSGSFDASAIRWSLARNLAEQVLREHEGAVDAVAILPDGRDVTAGEDGRIALWTPGQQHPDAVLEGHKGPVVVLALSPDGKRLASGSWDGTVRLWPLAGGAPRVFDGHRQNVNAVAFSADGSTLVSAGYDGTLRLWPLRPPGDAAVTDLPTPLNALAIAPHGEIVAGGADGKLYFLSPAGELAGVLPISEAPISALAMTRAGDRIGVATMRGALAIVDRRSRRVLHDQTGDGRPIWAVVFLPDGKTLLSGGADRLIHRWDGESGRPIGETAAAKAEDPLAAYAGDPGAELFRACIACHTLRADQGSRAGPTLHGIFGRRIASLRGYNFSPALKRLDIVWTPETLAKLFELGPARYTPGTKMPEQRITRAEDRAALIRFLQHATR